MKTCNLLTSTVLAITFAFLGVGVKADACCDAGGDDGCTCYFGTGCGDVHSCPVSACGALHAARDAPTTAKQAMAQSKMLLAHSEGLRMTAGRNEEVVRLRLRRTSSEVP